MTPADISTLTASSETHLLAERKSPHTIRTYMARSVAFTRWCDREGIDVTLDHAAVEKFSADLLARAAENRLSVDEVHKLNLGDL
jgi:integrase/recombinase XerD